MENFKVVLVGDTNVGKTSILQRYAKDNFETDSETTISPTFLTRMIDFPVSGVKAKLQIWDTAGQEKYRSVTPIYYRDAAAAICVFDVTNRQSLDDARKWLNDLRQYAPPHLVIRLAGNKCDLYQQEEVSLEEAKHFQEENKIEVFQQTSAKENIGIEDLFKGLLEKLEVNKNLKKQKNPGEVIDGRTISNATNNQGKSGDVGDSGKCKC